MAIADLWAEAGRLSREVMPALRRVDGRIRSLASDLEFLTTAPQEDTSMAPGLDRQGRLQNVQKWADHPGVCGIYGISLAVVDSQASPLCAELLVDATMASTEGMELSRFRAQWQFYLDLIDMLEPLNALEELIAVQVCGINRPSPYHCTPGTAVSAVLGRARDGTLGCRVTTASGAPGVTTAGHVVCAAMLHSVVGGPVEVRCDQNGCGARVSGQQCHSYSCSSHGLVCQAPSVTVQGSAYTVLTFASPMCRPASCPPEADIAVLALPDKHEEGRSALTVTGSVLPRDHITVLGRTSWAKRAILAVYEGYNHAAWEDVVDTAIGISKAGQSGAPATRGAGELIGHVVGGCPQDTFTYVQDITCQLTKIGASFRP
ncbi:hypothetical protein ABZ345_44455 [Lentzea sp. NPDC005914]|uniref:hypothetical protein n=1 Tax=Lentzea sp. NPDC005914 TaxID=3154572 RepID=UPI0033D61CF6